MKTVAATAKPTGQDLEYRAGLMIASGFEPVTLNVQITLTPELWGRIAALANDGGKTLDEIASEAIDRSEWLLEECNKAKDQAREKGVRV